MSNLYLIPELKDMERIGSLASEYGCAFEYNDFYNPDVLDDEKRQEEIIEEYKKYRSDFSQDTMHGAFLDVTIHSSDSLIREASMLRLRQSMKIAQRMGLKGVVFHTGRLANFRIPSYLEHWEKTNKCFFLELAQEYPEIEIYMENMFDEAPDVLAAFANKMKVVPNFGVCLDYAHGALAQSREAEWVEALAPYIRHMHINDNDLKNDLHQPIGDGRLDWAEFNRLIETYHVASTVLVEVKGYEAQKKSLEYMKRHGIFPMKDSREEQDAKI